MKNSRLLAACAAVALATPAMGATMSSTVGIEGFGVDGGGDGSSATPTLVASVTFTLPAIASLDAVHADLAHNFGSDITIELIAPGGGGTFLIVEGDGPTGNPHQGGGDSDELGDGGGFLLANIVGYTLVESGAGTAWLDGGTPLPGGTYDQRGVGAESWASGPFAAGDWTYNLYDSWDTADEGSVGDVGLSYTVPEPGSLALLGLGGLALLRRRR